MRQQASLNPASLKPGFARLPASLLNVGQRDRLADAFFAASRRRGVELHFNKGLAGAPAQHVAAASETAMNPQALSAFALAIIAAGDAPAYPGLPGAKPADLPTASGGRSGDARIEGRRA